LLDKTLNEQSHLVFTRYNNLWHTLISFLSKIMINGELHKLELTKGKQMDDDDSSRSYTTQFTTQGYDSSKSGERKEILIILEVSY